MKETIESMRNLQETMVIGLSKAVTSFTVEPHTATTPPTATPQTDIATTGALMTTMAIGVIAIIIAIAIVGLLLLRKKP